MKIVAFLGLLFTFLNSTHSGAAMPKDDDELMYIPKATKLVNQRDILVPAGHIRVLFQNGIATLDGAEINGNNRYCFMLMKTPSTRDRILEKDTELITNGTYRSASGIIELEIAQPSGVFDVGCINGPAEILRRPTIGQFKKEVQGIFEVVMPGPDPID